MIFYESPHRILKTLRIIENVEKNVSTVIVRELSKMYEEILRGKISSLISLFENNPDKAKGEITVVMSKDGEG